MKTKIAVCLLAGLLALPASVALLGMNAEIGGASLQATAQDQATTTPLLDDLVDEQIEFDEIDPALADLVGCDGLHLLVTEEGEASATFYTWVWDEEQQDYVQQECEPAPGLPEPPAIELFGLAPLAILAADDLVNEDIDFEPEVSDAIGCDGLHLRVGDDGSADASFYDWVWDEVLQDYVKEECEPLSA
jgi:hypothetical protein